MVKNWISWYICVIPEYKRYMQKVLEFESSLGYMRW